MEEWTVTELETLPVTLSQRPSSTLSFHMTKVVNWRLLCLFFFFFTKLSGYFRVWKWSVLRKKNVLYKEKHWTQNWHLELWLILRSRTLNTHEVHEELGSYGLTDWLQKSLLYTHHLSFSLYNEDVQVYNLFLVFF